MGQDHNGQYVPDNPSYNSGWYDGRKDAKEHLKYCDAELARLRAENAELTVQKEHAFNLLERMTQDKDCAWQNVHILERARQAQDVLNAELRKDVERLSWLESNPRHAQILIDGVSADCVFYGISCAELVPLRAAIDAAMEGEKT